MTPGWCYLKSLFPNLSDLRPSRSLLTQLQRDHKQQGHALQQQIDTLTALAAAGKPIERTGGALGLPISRSAADAFFEKDS